MENTYESTVDFIGGQKLELAARNLARLTKISEEQYSLESIVNSLQETIIDAHAGNCDDFSDILATQARILDATFHFYIDNAKEKYGKDDKINIALRAQRQTDKAINTWKRIKTEPKTKKFAERTRQMLFKADLNHPAAPDQGHL